MNGITLLWVLIFLVGVDIIIHVVFGLLEWKLRHDVLWSKKLHELQRETRYGSDKAIIERLNHIPHIKKKSFLDKIKAV